MIIFIIILIKLEFSAAWDSLHLEQEHALGVASGTTLGLTAPTSLPCTCTVMEDSSEE